MTKHRLSNISHSIHARLTFLVMLTALIIFSIVTVIIAKKTEQAVLKVSKENAMNRMEIANHYINSMLVGVEVAVNNAIVDIKESLQNPDEMYDIVETLVQQNPDIIGSAIAFEPNYYPKKGKYFSPYAYQQADKTISTKQLGTEDYDYFSMDWYKIPKEQKKSNWSNSYYDEGGGEQMMATYSQPLYDEKGHIYAIITADISLNWLTELVAESDKELNKRFASEDEDTANVTINEKFLMTHLYSFIIGKSGTYITHPLTERIQNDSYFTYCNQNANTADLQAGYDMVDGKSGMATFIRDNIHFTICYAPVARTGWSMATVMPSKVILRSARATVFNIIIIMLLAMIVLFVVCMVTVKRVTQPLVRFATLADEIAKGNLDTQLPEIHTKDEMKTLYDTFYMMQTSLKKQMEELKTTTASKTAIESELKVANNIQMSMLPKIFPAYPERDDIDIFGQVTPAKAVGGDLFDFYIRDEKLFFCIGDVSGKGIPAALVMAVTRAQFRTISMHESHPHRIVRNMNETMCDGNDSSMFVTLFVGVLDLPTGRLRYCNAGHDAPFIISNDDCKLLPCDSNLPIGVIDDWNFAVQEIMLQPMSTIFLYTDGLTEAENGHHKLFAQERIIEQAKIAIQNAYNPKELIEQMTMAVKQFVNGADQSDDLTMLAIQYTREKLVERYQNSLTLDNDVKQVPQLYEFVNDVCRAIGFDETTTAAMNLALEEAVVNVMTYAYPLGTKGTVNIVAISDDVCVKFIISDNGAPFDPTVVAEVDTTLSAEDRKIGGLGIYLVRQLMDSVNYERVDGYNVLTLRKNL